MTPLSPRRRLVALGLVGSALTSTAGTLATALVEGGRAVSWSAVAARLLLSYGAASAVVILLFPWVMPRVTAWLERRSRPPE